MIKKKIQTKTIQKLINLNNNGTCEIANDNAIGQIIVSGNKDSVNSLKEILKKKKIKCIPLNVSAPFHCSLMNSAAEKMKEKINNVKFNKPKVKIISNVIAKPEENPDYIHQVPIKATKTTHIQGN